MFHWAWRWELGFFRCAPGASLPRPLQEIPLHSNVYEVYATDKDEGLNGAVRYSFLKTTGNRDWEYFTIDPISGLIQTAQRLDREKQAVYSVRGRGLVRGVGPGQGAGLRKRRLRAQGHHVPT